MLSRYITFLQLFNQWWWSEYHIRMMIGADYLLYLMCMVSAYDTKRPIQVVWTDDDGNELWEA
jgi:hypothetical protein